MTSSASKPSGTTTAVTVSEYHSGPCAQMRKPHAFTAARTALARRLWRANTIGKTSSSSTSTDAPRPPSPVAVSLCVTSTALILCSLSAARRCRYCSSGTPLPHSTSIESTLRPKRWQRSTHNKENWPNTEATTLSPGDSVLATADSQPPVPEPGKTKTCPSV